MNKIIRCHLKKEIETQTVYLAGEAFLGVEGRREKHVGGQSLGTFTGTHTATSPKHACHRPFSYTGVCFMEPRRYLSRLLLGFCVVLC